MQTPQGVLKRFADCIVFSATPEGAVFMLSFYLKKQFRYNNASKAGTLEYSEVNLSFYWVISFQHMDFYDESTPFSVKKLLRQSRCRKLPIFHISPRLTKG